MQVLSKDELQVLMETHDGPCVSLFLPLPASGPEAAGSATRLKNLLREAEERLRALGLKEEEGRRLLQPAWDFLADGDWAHRPTGGLALFVSAELLRHYRLPYHFPELVVVGYRFHLKPLLPLLTSDGHFHVLALSQNQVRLLKATRMTIAETELTDVPRSLAEILQYQEVQDQVRFHSGAPSGLRGRVAVFHGGHGGAGEDRQERIREFFRQVDRGLRQVLREHQAPLVLAGVEYLLALYREVSDYQHLVEEGLAGNPEELSAEQLHQRAWEVVAPLFTREQQRAAEQYELSAAKGLGTNHLPVVVPAAAQGRVGVLFVPMSRQQWGRFDRETGEVELHPDQQPGDQDLIDYAAVMTMLHGGRVYALDNGGLPDQPVAALLRY